VSIIIPVSSAVKLCKSVRSGLEMVIIATHHQAPTSGVVVNAFTILRHFGMHVLTLQIGSTREKVPVYLHLH